MTNTTPRTSSVRPEGEWEEGRSHGTFQKCLHSLCVFVHLDVFKMDPDFLENEEKYKTLKRGKKSSHSELSNHVSARLQLNQSLMVHHFRYPG